MSQLSVFFIFLSTHVSKWSRPTHVSTICASQYDVVRTISTVPTIREYRLFIVPLTFGEVLFEIGDW